MKLKRVLMFVAKLGFSVLLVGFFLRQVDAVEVADAARGVSVRAWCAAVGLFLTSNFLGALQWSLLLHAQDIRLPFRRVLTLYFVGVFFNNFLVSNIGGDAVRIYDLNTLTGKATAGFAATFMDRFIGLFMLIAFSVMAFSTQPTLWSPTLTSPMLQ